MCEGNFRMAKLLILFDQWYKKILTGICVLALFLMVMFTIYTVFMRYVFWSPPVWGDLMTVLSNIWLVFMALALTVREKEHIALNLLYSRLPTTAGFIIQQTWTTIIFFLGIIICVYGYESADTNFGKYWEMWYFTWEDNGFVFKPNYMPKSYPMMILPLAGALITFSAIIALIEDYIKYLKGTFQVSEGSGSG